MSAERSTVAPTVTHIGEIKQKAAKTAKFQFMTLYVSLRPSRTSVKKMPQNSVSFASMCLIPNCLGPQFNTPSVRKSLIDSFSSGSCSSTSDSFINSFARTTLSASNPISAAIFEAKLTKTSTR